VICARWISYFWEFNERVRVAMTCSAPPPPRCGMSRRILARCGGGMTEQWKGIEKLTLKK